MTQLLEIIGEDIALLSDTDLRDLIGQLCEADYRSAGLSTQGITWSGHQDAPDGGLDVVVRDNITPPSISYISRSVTGFQVKKPQMQPADIRKEMQPNGILREEIKGLIRDEGAYIIISSGSFTTNRALNNRINAMMEAVANESDHENLHLDFFDRGRVAAWVRMHPSLILWVRNKIGRRLQGWRPYENWASAPGGVEEEYLLDDGLRLRDGIKPTNKGLSVKDGLLHLRSALAVPGASVRLAGLSGVGKTRLVQALFDERVGVQALNSSQAFYTNMSDSPDPNPRTFAEQLIAGKTRAILIVDNCPPELHRRLTETCSGAYSTVSLLTVEYDVRDDLPDETSVYRLSPASEEIIEELIRKHFSPIGQVDARTIAAFSGGNARVAIALANTVRQGETLSGLHNEELFERLFWQRHSPNESLLISAEACSLVYSFEGTDAGSEESELKFLASLVEKSSEELYRDVSVLKERDLIQSRHVWRAVLPHAIANRLAKRALTRIPKAKLIQSFLCNGRERLLKSFTHRLNYLHDSDIAIEIANEWLAPDGWLGKEKGNFNYLGMEVFCNIAPVSPEKTLEAIERAAKESEGGQFTSRENLHYYEFARLLRLLAYDAKLFDRCVSLLCRYALSETSEENSNSTRDVLKSLFYIYWSGTHAPIEARARIIEQLLKADDLNNQGLGLFLLEATLEAWSFSLMHEFSFGARPRDYGYHPSNRKEVLHWYGTFIDICTRLALSSQPIALQARNLFADKLRGLWTRGGMFEAVENAATQIHNQRAWNEGWIAVRGIIKYDSKEFENETLEKLHRLEGLLKPNILLERARTFALAGQHHTFDLEDHLDDDEDASSSWRRVEDTTRAIGAEVARDAGTLKIILPELVSTENTRLYSFGRGLADGCPNKQELWEVLRSQCIITLPEKRNIKVFLGFLSACAESDPEFYQTTLDDLIDDDLLGEWFPLFQTTAPIDQRGIERLHEALDRGKAPIHTFQYLAIGRAHEAIGDDDLVVLLKKILAKEGGRDVVTSILRMRFHREKAESPEHSENLMAVARELLATYPFHGERRESDHLDYILARIASICLNSDAAKNAAAKICRHLMDAIDKNYIYAFDYPKLLSSLAHTQPVIFLDIFLGNDGIQDYKRRCIFSDNLKIGSNPIKQISDEDLICWCDYDPEIRYPLIAGVVQALSVSTETGNLVWNPIVETIFKQAPNLGNVLECLADSMEPKVTSGSRADMLQKQSVLFQSLYQHDNAEISAWAKSQSSNLQERIKVEQGWEDRLWNREQNESFE